LRGNRLSLCCQDSIKREWNDAAESWMDFVREGKDYYRDGLNNPAAFKLIGEVRGLAVLDVACGEGYNTRILARMGAKVTGIDFSEKMIEFARLEETKEKLGICYHVTEATDLGEFLNNHFHLVTCFMSFQDIKNFKMAISEVARVLTPGGRFVFSVPHPCFEKMRLERHQGKKVCATERYFGATRYMVDWDMKRLTRPFRTTSFHRTLSDYFDALHRSKLFVMRLVEPRPTQKQLRRYPRLQDALARPQSIIIESIKISALVTDGL